MVATHVMQGVSSWCKGKAIDCEIVVSEFELQSRYYVHFSTNTIGKVMNPLILPLLFTLENSFGIK